MDREELLERYAGGQRFFPVLAWKESILVESILVGLISRKDGLIMLT
jgi:hypothetical protein